MKKIEAIMDRPGAELLLADVENDSLLDFADVSIFESQSRFYKLRHVHGHQREWVPCVKLDLFIPDRETECAVKLIREHSHMPTACEGNINVIPIESTLEISGE
jgi:nitrogen regulatory protein PII